MRAPGTSFAHRVSGAIGVLIVAATGSALLLLLGPAEAEAVITEPIPADVGPAPPPIPDLPPAGETAPPSAATCGDWYRQSDYGARWPTDSTWWEYRCTYTDSYYYTTCSSMACPAFCWDCWWETWEWNDYYYWDGSDAVFYGESYSDSVVSEGEMWAPYTSSYWWDAPTARWYDLSRYSLTVSKGGSGSGTVTSSPVGISCGDSCEASFDTGTLVTLTASPDASSTFSGWSGPCSGTASCQVTMDQARSVTAIFAVNLPPNMPPHSSFSAACSGSSCSFDGTASSDADGTIVAYSWNFGDGGSGSGATAEHTYAGPGSYTVTLTVGDSQGDWDTASQVVTVEASAPPVVAPPPPTFISTPDDYSSDSTPTWTFSGEPGATFNCTLTKPFVGAWDGGGDGTQPEPDPVTVDTRACDSGSYTFDLGAYPDGTYVLSLTQTDAAGHASAAATDSFVLQRPVPPNAAPQSSVAFNCAALSCSFDGTASSDADGTIVDYSWNFGDGGSGSGATADHTYAGPGTYTVTLTVTDDDGSSAADSNLVTIEASPPPGDPASPILPPSSGEDGPPGPPPGSPGAEGSVAHPGAVKCGGQSATILGSKAGERLTGTPHKDVIAGLGGNDEIRGLGGGDVLCGGAGADRLLGGSGPDKLLGGPGADALLGGPGHNLETP